MPVESSIIPQTAHAPESHIGQGATAAELETLTDGSNADALHAHAGPTQAAQAAIEAETNQDTYVPPDLVRHSPGVAKAWLVLNDFGALLSPSYNIASVTDSGVGDWTIVTATDFSTNVYAISSGRTGVATAEIRHVFPDNTRGVGSVDFDAYDSAAARIDYGGSVCLFGDQ